MRTNWSIFFGTIALAAFAAGGELEIERADGLQLITLKQGPTIARVAPEAGANVFSIQVHGVEYLRQPESMDRIAGVSCGTPVLYPTPNRVKNASFSFEGTQVEFEPNAGRNFIHGLVNRHAWEVAQTAFSRDSVSVTCRANFGMGTDLHNLFPFGHQLLLTIQLKDSAIRWTYEVDNREGSRSVPFGFALHPYFVYQGPRAQTYLTIPASHWMESVDQLPTGRLVPANQLDFPLGQPLSLDGTTFDDVFWGMVPDRPTEIDFKAAGLKVTIAASNEFTHLVVWTPQRPFFGIESQTCSTDAHNLHTQGQQAAAHLQICPPGETRDGWVEYRFANIRGGQ